MKIAIATPLYPPDTAPAALYAKDLARRLCSEHEVSVLAYSYIPEEVAGVRTIPVSKRAPLAVRVITYIRTLRQGARTCDGILAINGASVELPLIVLSYTTRIPYVLVMRDIEASERARRSIMLSMLESLAKRRAKRVITSCPPTRPEILPLDPYPKEAMEAYEAAWQQHVRDLTDAYGD